MSDALTPLRQVYGEEPPVAPLASGSAERAEHELLRQMRAALDTRPALHPAPSVVDAVLARAAEASARSEDAVTDPALGPLASADGLPLPFEGVPVDPVEAALLSQTAEALDRLPTQRPTTEAVQAVLAFAAQASTAPADAVRYVYGDQDAVPAEMVEIEVLRQSREVVERALASRPKPRPDAAVIAAIQDRAAEESGRHEEMVADPSLAPLASALGLPLAAGIAPADPVETALLAQTDQALDRFPIQRPDAAAVDAVLAFAAQAVAPASARPAAAHAADRPAERTSRRRTTLSVWAGGAGLMLAALLAVVVLPSVLRSGEVPEAVTVADAQEPAPAETLAPRASSVVPEEDPATQASSPALAGAAAASAFVPVREVTPPAQTPRSTAQVQASEPAPGPPPGWEVDEDLSALALRVGEMDRETEGLIWDEPAEAFGRPSGTTARTAIPGVQAVRAGGAPARVVVRPDSTRQR